MKRLLVASIGLALALTSARADYVVKDGNAVLKTLKAGTLTGSVILPYQVPVDPSGIPFGPANPLSIMFGSGILLPSFATPQHVLCDSGCLGGLSVSFGGAIGGNGTPTGFKDGSGNFQPLLGDVTNGLWVNIKASVPIAVTGTFFQATQPISAAALPLPAGASTSALQTTGNTSLSSIDTKTPALGQALSAASTPVVLPAAQITALTPLSSVAVTNVGTFAVQAAQSGTWNITNISGTISLPTGASTAALQTTGNTSLSSIDTKTPALGQALAAGSTPVVLTAIQLASLTAPTIDAGSTGTDSSASGASIPANVDFVLLATVAVNATRALVGVQNQGGATIQVVRDDGAGANQTSLFLANPFASWTSQTFKGRVRIYGLSGSSVAAYQD